MNIDVVVTDPWEFVTKHGAGPFAAEIVRVGANFWAPQEQALLVRLKRPLTCDNAACEYFIASPRYQRDKVGSLAGGSPIVCALTAIPLARALGGDPFDLSWWRGGIKLIATLQKA